jgi:hypothetical protein
VGLLALALIAAPGAGAALSAGYTATEAPNPPASASNHFGANIVDAGDVNGDGKDDLLVGVPDVPDPGGLPSITGEVVFIDGQTGGPIGNPIRPPTSDTLISHTGAPTAFGAQVATVGDLNGDGVPEHIVSAPGSDLSASAVDMGIVYVLDGKPPFAILKRIELAADDRPASSPGFGEALSSAGGEPACAGFGGTADCPDAPSSPVARGDLDGGGKADILIGAPDYEEDSLTDTNPDACPGPGTCPGLGRVYVFSGEDVAGSPSTPLVTPSTTIKYFDQPTAGEQPHLGAALSPIGDVGSCAVQTPPGPANSNCTTPTQAFGPSDAQDGYPDFLVSAPGLSSESGKTFVFDGHQALAIAVLGSPNPEQGSGFGPPATHQTAPGNLGASALPDIYLSATGQGRAYVFNGDLAAPGLLGSFQDAAGYGVFAGLGDVAGHDSLNEFAIGRLNGGPVQIVSSCGMQLIQTIPDFDPGNGFGAAIAPMGDLNGDGYLDFAIGAPGHNGGAGGVYLVESNASPGPDLSCNPPSSGGGGGSGGGGSPGTPSTPGKPKTGGRKVSSLARRTIAITPSKTKLKIGAKLGLRGRLKASKRKNACRSKQKIAIQRSALNVPWTTIDVAISKKNGSFAVTTIPAPAQIFYYRAKVNQTRRCKSATSKPVKVKVTA